MFEAILWDNDGVLVDTERLYYRATADILRSVGHEMTDDEFVEYFLVQNVGIWHLLKDRSPDEIRALRDARNVRYTEFLSQETLLIDGAVEVVHALRARYRMACVTSSRADHFRVIHRDTGLLPCFEFVLTSDDCTHTKPHPEPYERAVARIGIEAKRCLVVEDSERGLIAARRAGLACVVIPNGLTARSRFEGALVVLRNLRELPELLDDLDAGSSVPTSEQASAPLPARAR
jgi:HAD superfamily hydrolase (TIGR01509 family)